MPFVMLRPNWPSKQFSRTVVVVGKDKKVKSSRHVQFVADVPVELSAEELAAIGNDIGQALFEVEFDEKKRPRFVESVPTPEATPIVETKSEQTETKKTKAEATAKA